MAPAAAPAAPDLTAELLLPAQAALGEGALWNGQDQRLYWVDIEGRVLHIFDPATGHDRQLPTGSRVSTVVPAGPDSVLVALQTGIHRLHTTTGALTPLTPPLPDPNLRYNDGKCDPAGRFWVGTMVLNDKPRGAGLYRLDADHRLYQLLEHVTISNGLVWTADQRTMYYIDTPTLSVQAFDYDHATGAIGNGRIALRFAAGAGSPDGMTIDAAGNLWIALWGGSRVVCHNPVSGQLLQTVHVPAPYTASCAFGGPDLQTLFITTARAGLSEEILRQYPHSGDLFQVRPGATGVPANSYRDHTKDIIN
ncbi:SMP-30/gluconolactonase/LRE family protein [Hymenobacter persicinus]|uniref:SMP-30/gluconolactonase/LRE family protein n=1 Tax=Hymenobacter persicinus TaxID=2025506 RepID=A0A4Q5L8R4_9BACT|nr:SMP-30/gluconolactonase/LRE family protein [Hymenobacter persicinus]RYU78068.1 SMP-30/gluconolactonase/LRE family protein [Hymenobacter persicinus]